MPELKNIPKPQPIVGQKSGLVSFKKRLKLTKLHWIIVAVVTSAISIIAGIIICYNIQISPVGGKITDLKKVVIAAGSSSSQIGQQLQDLSIIRSATAFNIYYRLFEKNTVLQTGVYRLSPAESTPQIVKHLISGSVDKFNITFLPGGTLSDAVKTLKTAGYSDQEIKFAMNMTYSSPLFASKPSISDLEGYIYGETYNFNVGVTVENILQTTFDEFYSQIQSNNLMAGFVKHNLNLFQAVTLASIVQREASSPQYQKQVAQVFYSRLQLGMVLGSDVTYQYIADKTGVPRDPNLNSPYNTRRYPGLPPGPIATPGLSALQSVADPANSDFLYFLAGDDGIMYFAHTLAEHEANIANHCKVNCSTP